MTDRLPASVLRELVALRAVRDTVTVYFERYLQAIAEDPANCISRQQYVDAGRLSDALEEAAEHASDHPALKHMEAEPFTLETYTCPA